MKKKLISVFFMLLLCITTAFPASAEGLPLLVDDAGVLDDSAYEEILESLEEVSERQKADVVIVTINSIPTNTDAEAYADDFYDYNGYGQGSSNDGILFLISVQDRKWHITTTGFGIQAFTDAGLQYIFEQMKSDLGIDDFESAFRTFAEQCDDFLTKAWEGEPYDEGNMPKGSPAFAIFISILIGLAIGFISVTVMKSGLKTVRQQNAAAYYTKEGSLDITRQNDTFVRRNVTRTKIERESSGSSGGGSSTHTSSSGTSHGGAGGSF